MYAISHAKKEDCQKCAEMSAVPELITIDGGFITTEYLIEFIDTKGILFVAKEGRLVLGYVLGEILVGGFAYISFLVVDKTSRSKRIGKKLLNKFEDYCRDKGAKYIFLHATTKNEKTLHFYQREKYTTGKTYVAFGKCLN